MKYIKFYDVNLEKMNSEQYEIKNISKVYGYSIRENGA